MIIPILAAAMLHGTFTQHEYTGEAGSRTYWLYVPSSYDSARPAPLVVMLHGCTQDANDFARGTRMNEYAEKHGFAVVYPEQPAAHNPIKCWNWFDAKHQARDAGEPAIIAGITRQILSTHRIDAGRVFLAGISAGAAMANIVAVTHPELYTKLALHSGLEYKAATSVLDARRAMSTGGPDPAAQAVLAFAAMGERARVIPTLIINGSKDASVPPLHAGQLAAQWLALARLLGIDRVASESNLTVENGYAVTRTVHVGGSGDILVLEMMVDGLGHAWSGGSPAGTYTDEKGPDATAELAQFFGLDQAP